jgi:hypothetical protein
MITSGNLPFYRNCIYNIDVTVDSPISGFEFSIMETGVDGSFKTANLISFSGQEGYLFDQSGNFFDGYTSGVPFDLQIHHDFTNKTFSYYKDGILMGNGLDITGASVVDDGKANLIMFTKHGDSSLSVEASGSIS